MRTLPWQISPEQFAKFLKQLRFRYFKWDAFACGKCLVLPESIVLTRTEHDEVVRIAEDLAAMLARVEDRLAHQPDWLKKLAVPKELFPILASEPPAELQIARYDLFRTPDGRWMVTEFNDDVPGGFNEMVGVPELLGGSAPGGRFAGDLRAAVLEAFHEAESIGLMFATGYSEDLQHMLILESWFEQTGRKAVLCSPDHLEWRQGRFSMSGQEIDAVFRFYPGEWMPSLPNLRLWRRHGRELKMMNPLRRLIRQSKLLFSIWLEDGVLRNPDRELVKAHAPYSEPFQVNKVERYTAERDRWVLKRAFGRMGDSVVMGNLSTPGDWSAALAQAAKIPGQFTMQDRFEVEPIEFAAGRLYPTVGVYLVNGRFAGYYSRAAPEPFLTHEAYHVATVVEDT